MNNVYNKYATAHFMKMSTTIHTRSFYGNVTDDLHTVLTRGTWYSKTWSQTNMISYELTQLNRDDDITHGVYKGHGPKMHGSGSIKQ